MTQQISERNKCSNCGLPATNFFMGSSTCMRCISNRIQASNDSEITSLVANMTNSTDLSRPADISQQEVAAISAAYSYLLRKDKQKSNVVTLPVNQETKGDIKMDDDKRAYGETKKVREKNGQALKSMREDLDLSANQAFKLLGLKNINAITNNEHGCSTDKFNEMTALYKQAKIDLASRKEALPGGLNKRGRPKGSGKTAVAASPVVTKPITAVSKPKPPVKYPVAADEDHESFLAYLHHHSLGGKQEQVKDVLLDRMAQLLSEMTGQPYPDLLVTLLLLNGGLISAPSGDK